MGGRSGMVIDEATLRICWQPQTAGQRVYLPLILRNHAAPTPPTPTSPATPTSTLTPTPTATPPAIPTVTPGFVPTPYWTGQLTLPAGSRPQGVAVNAAGDRIYVAFHGVAVIPGSSHVAATNRQTANASAVDPAAGAVVQTIPANLLPDDVLVAGDCGRLVITAPLTPAAPTA